MQSLQQRDISLHTVVELKKLCDKYGIKTKSNMKKDDILDLLYESKCANLKRYERTNLDKLILMNRHSIDILCKKEGLKPTYKLQSIFNLNRKRYQSSIILLILAYKADMINISYDVWKTIIDNVIYDEILNEFKYALEALHYNEIKFDFYLKYFGIETFPVGRKFINHSFAYHYILYSKKNKEYRYKNSYEEGDIVIGMNTSNIDTSIIKNNFEFNIWFRIYTGLGPYYVFRK